MTFRADDRLVDPAVTGVWRLSELKRQDLPRIGDDAPRTGDRLLVVDDDESVLLLMRHYLESVGYQVQCSSRGLEALKLARSGKPDVLLLDVEIPDLSGIEVCRILKADPETLTIPVLMVTSRDSKDDRIDAYEAGADDYLTKPVSREELLARVRAAARLSNAWKMLQAERLGSERRRREQLVAVLERYLSPRVAAQVLLDEQDPTLLLTGKDRKTIVAMFADLRGFTAMTESLPADRVVQLLNDYFGLLAEVTHAHDGTVFNMAGDGLLVGFGAPLAQPDAATRGLRAACETLCRFEAMSRDWHASHGVQIGLCIGLSQGDAVVGNVGSPTYMSYTMIGDTVNVAARLGQAGQGSEILLSESMYDFVKPFQIILTPEALPPLVLKGRSRATAVYRITVEAAARLVPLRSPEP
jgi:class 3 adenylate cyclase/CheY-like chemotaxis protein